MGLSWSKYISSVIRTIAGPNGNGKRQEADEAAIGTVALKLTICTLYIYYH